MISFVIPAHNEESWIGRCVAAVHHSAAAVGEPYEVIVVDDGSTDSTAQIAGELGATVIRVEHLGHTEHGGTRGTGRTYLLCRCRHAGERNCRADGA